VVEGEFSHSSSSTATCPRVSSARLISSKFKVSRGGGRNFSRDLNPRDILKGTVRDGDEEESEEESSEEESSEDDDQPQGEVKLSKEMAALNLKLGNTEVIQEQPEEDMSRAERKAQKKAKADAKAKKGKQSSDEDESDSEEEVAAPKAKAQPAKPQAKPQAAEMSRKERLVHSIAQRSWLTSREAAEKKAAADRYAKLHAQGGSKAYVRAQTDG